ncbi:MAG: WYL domain-containing protein [Lewinellaceae bacterium]|nr:WYL domain-containing protein [Lewinellaceae bacterium]
MGFNKLAGYRYRLIDYCLRNRRRRWTFQDLHDYINWKLQEEFDHENGVSERQLLYDFALMRKDPPEGYGAPIVRKKGFVYYSDPEYSMSDVPLNEQDLQAMREALQLLRPFDDFPYFGEIRHILEKLEGKKPGYVEGEKASYILFENNKNLKGRHWLHPLLGYMLRRRPVQIHYHPFNFDEGVGIVFHPYLLKEFNNRWFVMGWNETEGALWNLALDRIQAIEVLPDHPFQANTSLDAQTYFRDIIGVTLPADMEKEIVRFQLAPSRAPYVDTKPLHHSQRRTATLPDGRVEFEIEVIPNLELESLLLSFGPDLEVLSPASLRERLGKALKAAVARY